MQRAPDGSSEASSPPSFYRILHGILESLLAPSTAAASVREAGDVASGAFPAPGAFLVKEAGNGDCGEALPGERDAAEARRGHRVGKRDQGEDGRPQVLRPARELAAHDDAASSPRRRRLRRGARL